MDFMVNEGQADKDLIVDTMQVKASILFSVVLVIIALELLVMVLESCRAKTCR
jgi:hypothetical protein